MSLLTLGRLSCKFSSSLRPNNLSFIEGCAGYAFIHRNQVVILDGRQINEKSLRSGTNIEGGSALIGNTTIVAYEENEDIAQVKWVQLGFGVVLLLITENGLLQMYSDGGQKLLHIYRMEKPVEFGPGIASNGADRIYIGTSQGDIRTFQVHLNQLCLSQTLTSNAHTSPISHLQAYRNILASGDVEGNIVVWDLGTNQPVASFGPFQSAVNSLAVHDDVVVAGFLSGHVRIIQLSKDVVLEIAAHQRAINAVDIDPKTGIFACASEDTFVSVFSLPDANNQVKCLGSMVPTPGLLTGISCSGSQSIIVVSAYDSHEIFLLKLT